MPRGTEAIASKGAVMTGAPEGRGAATSRELSRRTLLRSSAWAAPVIVMAAAVPASMASEIDLGAIQLNGVCGTLGVIRNGFDLVAAQTPIPVGTVITLYVRGGPGFVWDISDRENPIILRDGDSKPIVVESPIGPFESLRLRATLSGGTATQVEATVTLPAGYVATGSKLSAYLLWTGLGVCQTDLTADEEG